MAEVHEVARVFSKSKHDMLQTYEFLRYSGPAEAKLRRLLGAWDIINASALDERPCASARPSSWEYRSWPIAETSTICQVLFIQNPWK